MKYWCMLQDKQAQITFYRKWKDQAQYVTLVNNKQI